MQSRPICCCSFYSRSAHLDKTKWAKINVILRVTNCICFWRIYFLFFPLLSLPPFVHIEDLAQGSYLLMTQCSARQEPTAWVPRPRKPWEVGKRVAPKNGKINTPGQCHIFSIEFLHIYWFRSLFMLKILGPPIDRRRPKVWWHRNTQITVAE